jgi:hypothetical protein
MAGEIRKPLVIDKSKKPRCFKNMDISSLPVIWKFNKKAWMTTEIMEQWLRYFNADMRSQNRNVLIGQEVLLYLFYDKDLVYG